MARADCGADRLLQLARAWLSVTAPTNTSSLVSSLTMMSVTAAPHKVPSALNHQAPPSCLYDGPNALDR